MKRKACSLRISSFYIRTNDDMKWYFRNVDLFDNFPYSLEFLFDASDSFPVFPKAKEGKDGKNVLEI